MCQENPCPPNVLINTRFIERSLRFCKELIKNQYSESGMNDAVKDEFRPNDKMGYQFDKDFGNNSINRLFSEKAWSQLLLYSKLE